MKLHYGMESIYFHYYFVIISIMSVYCILHISLHMLVNTLSAYPLSLLESFTYNYLNISVPPSQVYSKSNTWVKILWSKKQEISSKCIGKVVAYHRLKNDKIHKTRVKSCLTPRRWEAANCIGLLNFWSIFWWISFFDQCYLLF